MSTIKIKVSREINVPEGTKLVSQNSGFITLAKQSRKGFIDVIVYEDSDTSVDLFSDYNWFELSITEMKRILKTFK